MNTEYLLNVYPIFAATLNLEKGNFFLGGQVFATWRGLTEKNF